MDQEDERLAALDAKDCDPFARTYGPSLDADLLDWIRLIVETGPTQPSFDRLNTLAWYIFVERQGAAFGHPVRFNVGPKLAEFQEYVYEFNVFDVMDIPYSEWQSVVERLFSALTQIASSSKFNLESSNCLAAKKHASEVLARLTQDPEYNQRYCDLLNGAL